MLKINNVIKQLKFFNFAYKHFARLNNTRLNKSVLLNNKNNSTLSLNEDQKENIPEKTKAK